MPILGRSGIGPVTSASAQIQPPAPASRILAQPTAAAAVSGRMEFTSPIPVTRQVTVTLPTSGSIVTAWNAAIAAAQSGDELLIGSGSYTSDGNLDITKSGITITFAEVTITHTNTTQHGLRVRSGASNVLIKGTPAADSFTIPKTALQTTGVSGRGDQNVSGHATFLVDEGSTNVYVQDVLFSGAKGTGCFNYGGVGVFYNRVWSRNSLADGFHNTGAARNVRAWDCTSQNSGDDGFAVVHYSPRDPANRQSSDVFVRRHRVLGTTHGRGLAAVNCPDVHFEECFVRDSDAAGLWIVNERTETSANAPAGISNVTADNLYFYNCNTDTGVDHGPWGILNSEPSLTPTGLVLTDMVTEASPTGAWTRVVNTNATVTRWKHYGPTDIQCFISNATVTDQGTWTKPAGTTATPGQPQFAASTASGTPIAAPGGRPVVSVSPVVQLDGDTLGTTGTSIPSWVDSANSRTFTAGGTGQPVVVDAPNSHRGAKFDGRALISDAASTARSAVTVVMVMRLDAVPTVARSGFIAAATSSSANDYATDGGWTLSGPFATSETGFDSMLVGGSPTGADSRIKTTSQPLGQWVIVTAVIGTDGIAVKEYTNGTVDPVSTGGSTNANLTLNRLVLGSRHYAGPADYNRYSLAHLRIYPARLSADERSTVHSEMQDRYGITVSDYVAATTSYSGTAALSGSGTLTVAPASGGAQIAAVASAAADGDGSSLVNLTVPTGVTSAHLGVIAVGTANPTSRVPTIPGWTRVVTDPSGQNNSATYLFKRLGGQVAGETITATMNGADAARITGVWYDSAGRDVVVIGTPGTRNATSSAQTVVPGLTTTAAKQDVIVFAAERTTATGTTITSWSPAAPITDHFSESQNPTAPNGVSHYFGHFTANTAGPTGDYTATYSGGSANGAGAMLAVAAPVASGVTVSGTANLTGAGSLTATGTAATSGTATLSGSGSLSVVAATTGSGAAALTGSGTLTATGAAQATGTAALTGSGQLTATGIVGGSSSVALTGSGSLTATGKAATTANAALTGTGTLSATGAAAEAGTVSVNLTGSGTLAASGTASLTRVATFTGTGALTTSATPRTSATVNLSGSGTLTVAGVAGGRATVGFTGSGTLTVATAANLTALANLTGSGDLSAVRTDQVYLTHTYGEAGIALHLSTASLAGDGVSTASLTRDGTSTATIAAHLSTALINTTTV